MSKIKPTKPYDNLCEGSFRKYVKINELSNENILVQFYSFNQNDTYVGDFLSCFCVIKIYNKTYNGRTGQQIQYHHCEDIVFNDLNFDSYKDLTVVNEVGKRDVYLFDPTKNYFVIKQ